MKALKALITVGALLVLFASARADWMSMGPEGGAIYSGAVSAGGSPSIYVASTNTSFPLLRSTDSGASWEMWGANLTNYPRKMAVHPTDPNIMYGVVSSQFQRTTNGGTTWTTHSLGSNNNGNDIAVNPLNPDVIYVPTYRYDGSAWRVTSTKSTDGGLTWATTQIDTFASSTIYAVAIDPVDTTTVYIGGYVDGRTALYRSTDCGSTWTRHEFPANYSYVYSIYVSPADHNTVFAGTINGVCRSIDRGQTWIRQSTGIYNYQIVAAPDNPSIMYSAAYNTVYRSTDAGLTWTAGTGLSGTALRTVLVVPGENGAAYAGSTAGMFKSADYGATWQAANNGIVMGRVPVVTMSLHDPATVYVELVDNVWFKSTDAGRNWLPQVRPSGCGAVCNIALDPADRDRMYMLEGSG
ncbi:MAG: hypothetical protein R6X14_05280 [bacterium]